MKIALEEKESTESSRSELRSSDRPNILKGTKAKSRTSFYPIFAGSVGNLVEYYDFYIYASFSMYFASSFFSATDQTTQLLNAAGVFALGFLVRPIGAWLFGVYADIRGRRASLTVSVMLMCFGSLIIAVTPTYATIGPAAPAILIVARLLQGLSLGGEYGTSATYLSEIAPPGRRGLFSTFQAVTLNMGQFTALLVLLLLQGVLLTTEQLQSWGWRIPFLLGAVLAIVALFLRRGLAETPQFVQKGDAPKSSLRLLLQHPKQVLTVCGLTLGGTVAFYTYTTYMQKYLVNTAGLTQQQSTVICTTGLFVFMLLQPLFGFVSDKVGRRPVLMFFGVFGTLLTTPIMTAIANTKDPLTSFWLVLSLLFILCGYSSINALVKAEVFPTHVRALGVALPYAITVSIFGGSAEYVALFLKSHGHELWFNWYVTGCIAISLLVYARIRPGENLSE